jgi:hypothetical protein
LVMSSVDMLAAEIAKALQTYTKEVEEGMEKAKTKVAKESVKTLKATSPKNTGKYARGWRVKKVGTAQVIHNATRGSLTHLLEKGHAKVNGGRVAGIPHIRPVEQAVIKEYIKQIEQVIKG